MFIINIFLIVSACEFSNDKSRSINEPPGDGGIIEVRSDPTIGVISDKFINEDSLLSLSFSVSDADEFNFKCDSSSLSLTSSNNDILDSSKVVFSGSFGLCSMSLMPEENAAGIVSLTLEVSDGDSNISETFNVNIKDLDDVTSLSVGVYNNASHTHTCAVVDKKVKCWGANKLGQLGDGTQVDRSLPTETLGLIGDIKSVAVNYRNSCALKIDGTVWCWGHGTYGQNGNGSISQTSTPVQVIKDSDDTYLSNIIQLTLGYLGACALSSSGEVYCWGFNINGNLGNGNNSNSSKATLVKREDSSSSVDISNAKSIGGGGYHYCVILSDNSLWCWGRNNYSQLGNLSSVDSNIAKQVYKFNGVTDVPLVNVTSVDTGLYHTCAVDLDRKVWCWGLGADGRLGNGSYSVRNSAHKVIKSDDSDLLGIEVSAGNAHSCAITTEEELYCWGAGEDGQLGRYSNERNQKAHPVMTASSSSTVLRGVKLVSAGFLSTCAFANNDLYCFGANGRGGLGASSVAINSLVPKLSTDLSEVKLISHSSSTTDGDHTCFVLNNIDRNVKCSGKNNFGQLGNGVRVSSPNSSFVLDPSGTSKIESVTSISTSSFHSCLISSGQVYCFGLNSYGQLGNGTGSLSALPVKVIKNDNTNFDNATKISVGPFHSCAVDSVGQVWCWGYNVFGGLGNDTNGNSLKATKVLKDNFSGGTTELNNVVEISTDEMSSCAIDSSGQAWCWGRNNYGQLGNGTNSNTNYAKKVLKKNASSNIDFDDAKLIRSGYRNTCITDSADTLWCTGQGGYFKLGSGTTSNLNVMNKVQNIQNKDLVNIVSFDIGTYSVCAVDSSTKLWCWGRNYRGSLPKAGTYHNVITKPEVIRDPSNQTQDWLGVLDVTVTPNGGCVLNSFDQIYCFGENSFGQYSNGILSSSNKPVKVLF